MYVNDNNVTYFAGLGVECNPEEIKRFIGDKNVITNIYRTQAYIVWIDFILKVKSLLKYTNFFSPNHYEKNDKVIIKYFQ